MLSEAKCVESNTDTVGPHKRGRMQVRKFNTSPLSGSLN
jgi:hypothetical protein